MAEPDRCLFMKNMKIWILIRKVQSLFNLMGEKLHPQLRRVNHLFRTGDMAAKHLKGAEIDLGLFLLADGASKRYRQ